MPSTQKRRKDREMPQGTVKWFNAEKGFGFIAPGGRVRRDVFVHYNGDQGSGFRTLEENQKVEFEIGHSPKGPQATGVRLRRQARAALLTEAPCFFPGPAAVPTGAVFRLAAGCKPASRAGQSDTRRGRNAGKPRIGPTVGEVRPAFPSFNRGVCAARGDRSFPGSRSRRGQIVRWALAARLSVVGDQLWRASAAGRNDLERVLVPENRSHRRRIPLVRTEVNPLLVDIATEWTRGAVKTVPVRWATRAAASCGPWTLAGKAASRGGPLSAGSGSARPGHALRRWRRP